MGVQRPCRDCIHDAPQFVGADRALDLQHETARQQLAQPELLSSPLTGGPCVGRLVAKLLNGGEQLRQSLVPGVTLIAFLQAAVAAADGARVRVTVTGHSKGGALAPTLALWLADSQGAGVID